MTEQQVLKFRLNHETYCVNIESVIEIVRRSEYAVTSVPNEPPHVEGVMDLRGETTKIIDPRTVLSLDVSADVDTDKVIVFSDAGSDAESVGWGVTDVTEVSTIDTADVEEVDEDTVKGIINRDDGFLIWTGPEKIRSAAQLTA